jgi:hypothetical protein
MSLQTGTRLTLTLGAGDFAGLVCDIGRGLGRSHKIAVSGAAAFSVVLTFKVRPRTPERNQLCEKQHFTTEHTMAPARRMDWQAKPMSTLSARLTITDTYTLEEFAHISAGLVPQEMGDKWFIYYEEPWLYLHRSWTGYCIYRIRFEALTDGNGIRLIEAWVNRDPEQHPETNDQRDIRLLKILIDSRAQRNVRQLMVDYIRQGRSEA